MHNPPHPTQRPLGLMEYLIKTYSVCDGGFGDYKGEGRITSYGH